MTELRKNNGSVLYCICCGTNVARLEGVQSLADLDKASVVAIMDAIDEVHGFTALQHFDAANDCVEGITGATDVFGCVWGGSAEDE